MTLQSIPLGKLVLSAANFCKPGGIPIDDLAASIASSGLHNNLVVRSHLRDDGTPTDKYEVAAGDRRLAALKRLAKQKRLGAEEIAARFGTTDAQVRKLLRLASVSPRLMAA